MHVILNGQDGADAHRPVCVCRANFLDNSLFFGYCVTTQNRIFIACSRSSVLVTWHERDMNWAMLCRRVNNCALSFFFSFFSRAPCGSTLHLQIDSGRRHSCKVHSLVGIECSSLFLLNCVHTMCQ